MYEERHGLYKICPDCGANLDPGERCDCERERMHPLPRDGLRATCPYFRQRMDHQGNYTIECVGRVPGSLMTRQKEQRYLIREERDMAYEQCCCCGGGCETRLNWALEE